LGAVVISQTGAVTAYAATDCPPEDSGVDAGGETAEPTPTPTPTPSPDPEPSPDPSPSPDPEPSPSPDPEPECAQPGEQFVASEIFEEFQLPFTGESGLYGLWYPAFTTVSPQDWADAGYTLPLTIPGGSVNFRGNSSVILLEVPVEITVTEAGEVRVAVERAAVDEIMPEDRLLSVVVQYRGEAFQEGCLISDLDLATNTVFDFSGARI
ncbi:MAG TPA: hypothetical protein VFM95_07515, partial [Microcella sp.]|nr:hypothetical protein [Microcella sp.]